MRIFNLVFSAMVAFMAMCVTTQNGFDVVTGAVLSFFCAVMMYALMYALIAE